MLFERRETQHRLLVFIIFFKNRKIFQAKNILFALMNPLKTPLSLTKTNFEVPKMGVFLHFFGQKKYFIGLPTKLVDLKVLIKRKMTYGFS